MAPVNSYLYKATSGLLRPVDPIFYHLLPMCPVCTGDLPLPLGEGWGEGQSGNRGSTTMTLKPSTNERTQFSTLGVPAPAGDTNHRRPNDSRGSCKRNVALGLVPS